MAGRSTEMESLAGLGVSVRSHETLETEVMDRLEEKMREQEKEVTIKQVKKEFPLLIQKLKICLKKKKEIEHDIRSIHGKGNLSSHQHRKITSLLNDQEEVEKHLLELLNAQKDLLHRLTKCGYDFQNDSNIKPISIKSIEGNDEKEDNENPTEETELQKSIRLGEVTAFGTSVQTTSLQGSSSNFDDYIKDQIDHQAGGPVPFPLTMKRKREESPESDSGFIDVVAGPSKKKSLKKIAIKAVTENSDDSDWRPSDPEDCRDRQFHHVSSSEGDDQPLIQKKKEKKRRKKQRPVDSDEDVGGWKTDDSDWEGTDDESSKKKPRQKDGDDGDKERYVARLANWQAGRSEEEKKEDGRYEEMEGGLKAPSVIWDQLYAYQKVGVQWMFELHQQGVGGILGDEMGLGKTIQVAAFLASLSYSQVIWRGSKWRGLGPSIIVCPTTVLHQWVSELHKWWPPLRVAVLHASGSHSGSKRSLIRSIHSSCGLLVLSYQAITTCLEDLSNLDWHYVILDEGHKIRNPDAKVTLAVKQVATPHRLILSGSPMQNNLRELWSLFDFIYPGKLGTLPVFMTEFSSPITAGGYSNASTVQVATAFRCATILRDTISPYLLRRMKADVKTHINLPEKNEQVLFCRLTEEQRALYRAYIDGEKIKLILSGNLKVFVGLIELRAICNHPDIHSGGPKTANIDPAELGPEDEYGWYKRSGKMVVIHSLLKLWKKQGHRVLLFSQSRKMLKILETYVKEQRYSYLKMDGTTSVGSRQGLIEKYNTGDTFVFLLTTKVGGLGVNLTGANRVVIFDPDWNPSTDMQARERAWRIGQQNQVTIYRLMTAGTIEEKIYHRQIYKQFLVNRVLKDAKQRRFFKSNDLYELFTLTEATEEGDTETSAIFAGTGSNIKLTPSSSGRKGELNNYDLPVYKPKKSKANEAVGAKKNVKKSLKRLYKEDAKKHSFQLGKETSENFEHTTETSTNTSDSTLSDDLREKLREQARKISAKFKASRQENEHISSTEVTVKEETQIKEEHIIDVAESIDRKEGEVVDLSSDEEKPKIEIVDLSSNLKIPRIPKVSSHIKAKKKKNEQTTIKINKTQLDSIKPVNSGITQEKEAKSRKHKHKKHKHKKLEGERVEGLVKARRFKAPVQDSEEQQKVAASQDDYVLSKLFSKSGVISGIQHDSIMEDDTADYALVESEASEKAQRAVAAMKASRQQCMRAETGVPNWTGNNGGVRKPKFGAKKKQGTNMSSAELLVLMKNRNTLVSTVPAATEEERELFRPDHQRPGAEQTPEGVDQNNADLLADIRNFISFQARVDGQASTAELVARFQRSLPSQQSPLFKAFLQQICDFRRDQEGRGIWTLKTDFR